MHDTVGIIFQNVEADARYESSIEEQVSRNVLDSVEECPKEENSRKRRRTFDAITLNLESYSKKPKVLEVLQSLPAEARFEIPSNLTTLQRINLVWIFFHALKILNTYVGKV